MGSEGCNWRNSKVVVGVLAATKEFGTYAKLGIELVEHRGKRVVLCLPVGRLSMGWKRLAGLYRARSNL